ncbi:MAG: transglycosylase domain-containing protein [bacterium]|nr:transglycosylase domain-containing protein [bacterium]
MDKIPFAGSAEELLKQLKKKFWLVKKRSWLLWSLLATIGSLMALSALFVFGEVLAIAYAYATTWGLSDSAGRPFDWNKLSEKNYAKSSTVLTADDIPLGRFFHEVRDPITFKELPPSLVKGFVAAEDKRFFSHVGVDVWAINRAMIIDTFHELGWRYGQQSGASTISQQSARLLYAEESDDFRKQERTYGRKWREARVAIQLDRRHSKEQILETYANLVWYDHGINGVSEAVRYYFGKDIRKESLTIQEVSVLVAMVKNPRLYCPVFHPKDGVAVEGARIAKARDRYNWVIGRMRDEGYITEKEYLASRFEPLTQNASLDLPFIRITPLKDRDFGYGARFAKELLLANGFDDTLLTTRGGLRIQTTIDSHIQKIVSEKLRNHLADLNSELPEGAEKLNGAAIVLDLKTSKILALTGGSDFAESPFNRVMSVRSAGSASKLVVYSAYLRQMHASYEDLLPNVPFSMVAKVDAKGRTLKRWTPGNFQEKNPVPYGLRRIDEVFPRSVNLPALHAARKVGMTSEGGIVETAHRFGIWGTPGVVRDPNGKPVLRVLGATEPFKDGIDPYLPTAIAINANLIEITNAFAVTGRRGLYLAPSLLEEVRDAEGSVVYATPVPEPMRVEDPEISRKILVLLRAVTKYGTLKISMKDIKQEVACKTGTSHEANDFNVVCITPEFVIAVRIGYDHPKPIVLPLYMKRVSGDGSLHISAGWSAGPLMRRILDALYDGRESVPFPKDTEEDLAMIIERNR